MFTDNRNTYLCCLVMLFFTCQWLQPDPLTNFLEKVETKVEKADLEQFKNASEDSILYNFRKFEHEVNKLIEDSVQSKDLYVYFKQINHGMDLWFICFALHLKLNNRNYNKESVFAAIRAEFRRIDQVYAKEQEDMNQLSQKNVLTNIKNCQIGDKIKFRLPLHEEVKIANYEIFDPKDSLILEGILLEKIIPKNAENKQIETKRVRFIIRLTYVSEINCIFYEQALKPGVNIDLLLFYYTQLLEIKRENKK